MICYSGSNRSLLIVHKELLLMVHALLPVVWHQESHKDQCWVQFYFLSICINNITSNIHSQLRLFADNCLIYHPINSPQDHMILQDDILKLSVWADIGQMKFNVKMFCILRVCTLRTTSNFTYTMYTVFFYKLLSNITIWEYH